MTAGAQIITVQQISKEMKQYESKLTKQRLRHEQLSAAKAAPEKIRESEMRIKGLKTDIRICIARITALNRSIKEMLAD